MKKIIPTPQYALISSKKRKIFETPVKIFLDCKKTERLNAAISLLSREFSDYGIKVQRETASNNYASEAIVLTDSADIFNNLLSEKDSEIFTKNRYAEEQGYVLISRKDTPVIIYAKNDMGLAYGVTTLLQLIEVKNSHISIPNVHIRDYPEFRYRGSNWLTWAEAGVWSYDRGDGIEAFRKRIIDRLDFSLLYKVNLIVFDGFGWSIDRFPEYTSLMRDLNREARLRGIHLMFTGYTSSYGASGIGLYKGEVFENRKKYPDGKSYPCISKNIFIDHNDALERGGHLGTCLSNKKLMKLKIQELVDFVEKVEPGALYLHNIDVEPIDMCRKIWKKRCDECKKQWPDSNIFSEKGMAGAFAYFYSEIAKAVNGVKKRDYNPERDCLILNISPGYSIPEVDDANWDDTVKYWAAVSKYMIKFKNIKVSIREQFRNHNSDKLRISQMTNALKKNGGNHELAIALFYGAGGAYNDFNFLCNPAMNYLYEGSEVLMTNSGNAYQEPLQLFNAECSWNTASGKKIIGKLPQTYDGAYKLFNKYKFSEVYPEKVFGKDGFLKMACQKLYGECGDGMYKIFAMRGRNNECAVPYLWHMQFDITPFQIRKMSWKNQLDEEGIREYISRFKEMIKLNEKAITILSNLPTTENLKEELNWLEKSYTFGCEYSHFFLRYCEIYKSALTTLKSNKQNREKKLPEIKTQIVKLEKKVKIITKTYKPIDPYGGAWGMYKEAVDFIVFNYRKISESLKTGKIEQEEEKNTWW